MTNQTTKGIGPSFESELRAAELFGLCNWSSQGEIVFSPSASAAQREAILGVLSEHVATDPEEDRMFGALRAERDRRLAGVVAILDRHRNQRDFGLPTTLTEAQAAGWAIYAQALRDLPEMTPDPAHPHWPEVPR